MNINLNHQSFTNLLYKSFNVLEDGNLVCKNVAMAIRDEKETPWLYVKTTFGATCTEEWVEYNEFLNIVK
ncbi:MAG: hypothetical protein JXQ90_08810 [Cyclobacteriaceae bacterium]